MTVELVRKVSEQEVMSASALNDLRQTALTCRGHTRPVTYLAFSDVTADGYFLASACKGKRKFRLISARYQGLNLKNYLIALEPSLKQLL